MPLKKLKQFSTGSMVEVLGYNTKTENLLVQQPDGSLEWMEVEDINWKGSGVDSIKTIDLATINRSVELRVKHEAD